MKLGTHNKNNNMHALTVLRKRCHIRYNLLTSTCRPVGCNIALSIPRPFSVVISPPSPSFTTPWTSAPDVRRASRKKNSRCVSMRLAISQIVFSPRSTFDLVRSSQRPNFREKLHFLYLHAHSGVSMCRRRSETFTNVLPVQF